MTRRKSSTQPVKNTALKPVAARVATSGKDSAKSSSAATVRPGGGVKAKGKSGSTQRARATEAATSLSGRTWHLKDRTRFVTEIAGGTRKAADLLEVAPSQPSRWGTGASVPGPEQARMLVDIDHVLAHVLLVWADAGVARDWLTTPNAHLDGMRPVEWIRRHGTSEVVDALRAEAAGAYA